MPTRQRSGSRELLQPGDVVLVKGSRSVGLERVAQNTARTNGTSPRGGPARNAHLDRRRTEVHRVPPPERVRASMIREEGPAGHAVKQGTPTMGGLLMVFSVTVAVPGAEPLDGRGTDRLRRDARVRRDRLRRRLHQGPPPPFARPLRPVEAAPAGGDHGRASALAVEELNSTRASSTCRSSTGASGSRFGFYLLLFLIVAGAANGANLTDGIDGLAAGIGIIALLTFTAMNVFAYIRSGQFAAEQDLASLDHGDPRRRADRRSDRIPLVQRLPGRGAHGRHRLHGDRRRDRRASRS